MSRMSQSKISDLFKGDVKGPYVVANYLVVSKHLDLERIALQVASSVSVGLNTNADFIIPYFERLKTVCPRYKTQPIPLPGDPRNVGFVNLVIPLDSFVSDGNVDITQLLNVLLGNFFEEKEVTSIKLMDLEFSESSLDSFDGPTLGIDGLREITGTKKTQRPHIAVVPQPPLGLDAGKYAELCYVLAKAGADHIVDSDILMNPKHCSILDRAYHVTKALERLKKEESRTVLYSLNITSNQDKILEVAEKAFKAAGGSSNLTFAVSPVITGLSCLQSLCKFTKNHRIPIHVHITGLPLLARNRTFGLSYAAFNIMIRLLGADMAHGGSLTGRYLLVLEENPELLQTRFSEMTYAPTILSKEFVDRAQANAVAESIKEARNNNNVLTQKTLHGATKEIRRTFQLVVGGINPCNIEYHVRLLGKDIILLGGTSLFRDRADSKYSSVVSAVKAMRQAISLVMQGISVGEARALGKQDEYKELFCYLDQHGDEFNRWDWRRQPDEIKSMDRLHSP